MWYSVLQIIKSTARASQTEPTWSGAKNLHSFKQLTKQPMARRIRLCFYIPVRFHSTRSSFNYIVLMNTLTGWWGLVRHPNYIGDLIFSFCTCAGCGFSHIVPWTYFFFMASLLIHRALRDDARCSSKYGDRWSIYCKIVPWRLIPGIFWCMNIVPGG